MIMTNSKLSTVELILIAVAVFSLSVGVAVAMGAFP